MSKNAVNSNQIYNQVENITANLIEVTLAVDQKFPSKRSQGKKTIVDFSNPNSKKTQKQNISIALKNKPYSEIYEELLSEELYNFKLIDGAIVQMMYTFNCNNLKSHRLAFFPYPRLEEYQNNPEIDDRDEIFADIIRKDIYPFPIRFDYNSNNTDHPSSHLTLGQYLNCRIPVSAPLTPYLFMDFILRNFYNTIYKKLTQKINFKGKSFKETITTNEKKLIHLKIPE